MAAGIDAPGVPESGPTEPGTLLRPLDLVCGTATALASAHAAAYAVGIMSVNASIHDDLSMIWLVPAVGLVAGLAARSAAGGGHRGLQVAAAAAATSGGVVAVFLHLYGSRPDVLRAALRSEWLPPTALAIGADLKMQWSLLRALLRTGALANLAWIGAAAALSAAVAAPDPRRGLPRTFGKTEDVTLGAGRVAAGAMVLGVLQPPLSIRKARALLDDVARFHVVPVDAALVLDAIERVERHRLSYWDALVVGAARSAGCQRLISEDMGHSSTIDGVTIVNPFA